MSAPQVGESVAGLDLVTHPYYLHGLIASEACEKPTTTKKRPVAIWVKPPFK